MPIRHTGPQHDCHRKALVAISGRHTGPCRLGNRHRRNHRQRADEYALDSMTRSQRGANRRCIPQPDFFDALLGCIVAATITVSATSRPDHHSHPPVKDVAVTQNTNRDRSSRVPRTWADTWVLLPSTWSGQQWGTSQLTPLVFLSPFHLDCVRLNRCKCQINETEATFEEEAAD